MLAKCEIKIFSKEDVYKLDFKQNFQVNHFHLEINKELDDMDFKLLWDKIGNLSFYNRFHLDLQSCPLNDTKVDIIYNFMKNCTLREINYNFSNTKFTDEQFDVLLHKILSNIKGLEKLHLILENIDLNKNKLKTLNNLLNSLPNLKHVFVNIKRNKINLEEMKELTSTLNNFYSKEIHF